jgi:hypothetical protein
MSDSRRGFRLEIRFIDHFNTALVITLNYSATAELHTLQITTAHTKSFQSAFTFHQSFPGNGFNNGDTSLHRRSILFTDSLTNDHSWNSN